MIYYKEGSAGGLFNQFMVENHLEETAAFIQEKTPQYAREWNLPPATDILASIRLDKSRHLYVKGNKLYFCCTFDCNYVSEPEQDIAKAYGIALDVSGEINFHHPGTKEYALKFYKKIHVNYQYPYEEKNYSPNFPGVRVNQMLYPAFGYNEKQRHEVLEKEAERFLAEYFPEALDSVLPVPIRGIAEEKMWLRIYTGYKLEECTDVLGLTVFRTQTLSVTDEDVGESIQRKFPRGSILIDNDTFWNRGIGSFNFTLAHEMYHWYAHRVHMAFMDIVGRPEDYGKARGHLESQANGVGARILMPSWAVEQKYREAVERAKADGIGSDADTYEMAVTSCAAFFRTSKTAMKIRLQELGLHEKTREPAVRMKLDIVELFEQYTSDQGFRNLLDSGLYKCVMGYVVKNDPKYVQGDVLTEYAKAHPNECIMIFREEYQTSGDGDTDILFRKDAYFSRRADYEERMARNPTLMKRLGKELSDNKERFVSSLSESETFCDFIMPIITAANTKIMGLDIREEVDDGFDEGKLVLKPEQKPRQKPGQKPIKTWSRRYIEHYDFYTGNTKKISESEVFQAQTLIGYKMFERMQRNDGV